MRTCTSKILFLAFGLAISKCTAKKDQANTLAPDSVELNSTEVNSTEVNSTALQSNNDLVESAELPDGVTICDGSAPVGDVAAFLLEFPIPYCMNYGVCVPKWKSNPQQPCECGIGYEGPHCEFLKGSAPNCDLECFAGGICQVGTKSFEMVLNEWVPVDEMQYCLCPPGTLGEFCEREPQKCGEGHCMNGGKCVNVNGTAHCDCTTAVTERNAYAGQFCEHKSSMYCSDTNDHNGRQFCVNGGTCKGGSHLGCDCPDAFMGPICEFEATQYEYSVCDLQCKNGGICRKGAKDLSFLSKFDLNRHLQQYNNNFEHCVCPRGWVGLTCEYELDVCPGQQLVCMHGGTCDISVDETTGQAFTSCDCGKAQTANSRFAGPYCESKSSDFCTADGSKTLNGPGFDLFCTNGGICKGRVASQQDSTFPGCDCPEGTYGDMCEFEETDSPSESVESDMIWLYVAVFSALAALLVGIGYIWLRQRRQARRQKVRFPPIPKKGLKPGFYQDSPPAPTLNHMSMNALVPWKSKVDDSQTQNLQHFRPDDDIDRDSVVSCLSTTESPSVLAAKAELQRKSREDSSDEATLLQSNKSFDSARVRAIV